MQLELAGSVELFVALGQLSRWKLFLLLLHAGPAGLTRAQVNDQLGLRPTATSAHLRVLEGAGLVRVVPESRAVGREWGEGVATVAIDDDHVAQLFILALSELGAHAPAVLDEIKGANPPWR